MPDLEEKPEDALRRLAHDHLKLKAENKRLREALIWATGWIDRCSEAPLISEEPDDRDRWERAIALCREAIESGGE